MHIFFFICVTIIGFIGPFPLFLGSTLLYMFLFNDMTLLVTAVCIDACFGVSLSEPQYVYTLSVGVMLLGALTVKPFLRFYRT